MWNKDLAKLDNGENVYDTTGTPIWCPLGLTSPDIAEDVSIEEYGQRVTEAMRKGVPHPDLNYIPSSSLSNRFYPLAEPEYNSTTGSLSGYELNWAQNNYDVPTNNVTLLNGTETKWFFDDDTTLTSSVDGNNLKVEAKKGANATADSDFQIAYKGMPITYKGGNLRLDMNGLQEDTATGKFKVMTDFAVGLTRSKEISATERPRDVPFVEDGLMPRTRSNTVTNSVGNFQFFDYVIRAITDQNGVTELVVGHMVVKDNTTDGEMCMREIDYYSFAKSGAVDTPILSDGSGGRYSLTTNTKKITQFLIRVENDIVSFWFYDGGGSNDTTDDPLNDANKANWKKFCSADLYNWSGGDAGVNYKKFYPKPVNQNMWWMYPKVFVEQDVAVDYHLDLSCYSGVTRSGLTDTYYNPKYDWRVKMYDDGEDSLTKEIDRRYFNDITNTKAYTYMTIRSLADPYLKEQAWVVILQEDKEYYPDTTLAQDEYIGFRLGFPNMKLLRPDINGKSIEVGMENNQAKGNEVDLYL